MTFLNVKNNAASILASGISADATSLTVASGEGARFPSSNFHITIDDEILLCTTRSGDTLTVTRAQEDTNAAPHSKGAAVRLNITAAIITELQDAIEGKVKWNNTNTRVLNGINTPCDWTDLDLGPDGENFVSDKAKFAILFLFQQVNNTGTSGCTEFKVRKNGTNPTGVAKTKTDYREPNGVWKTTVTICALDSGQVMEYSITTATGASQTAYLDVLGYIE